MKHTIVILSPGPLCWKSKKIIRYLEGYLEAAHIEAEIIIVFKLKELLKYRTWILPTIVIDRKVVARGYKPSKRKLDQIFNLTPTS